MKWRWMIVATVVVVAAVLILVLAGCDAGEAFKQLQAVGR